MPLTIVANITSMILEDEKLYSSTILDDGKTKLINSLIIQTLPILKEMLNNNDLVFSALSFLALILERNSAFVQYYRSEKIITRIFDLLEGKLNNSIDPNLSINLNLIKIFIKLIESYQTTFNDIIQLSLIEKVNALISNDFGDEIIYTEYVIELFYDLMIKINEEKKKISNKKDLETTEFKQFVMKIEKVSKNFKLCIKLLGHENSNIQEKSCVCLIFILQLLGGNKIESTNVYVKFRDTDVPGLLKGLEYNCTKIHKRMIRIFRWIIEFQGKFHH